jgi:hypothetical protein
MNTALQQPDFDTFDLQRAAAFEERFMQALNEGGMLQLVSLGHRTGLLSRMADGVPTTVGALARASELNERYLREWLGGLTAAGVLEHDPEAMTYRLPPEFGNLLSDQGGASTRSWPRTAGRPCCRRCSMQYCRSHPSLSAASRPAFACSISVAGAAGR